MSPQSFRRGRPSERSRSSSFSGRKQRSGNRNFGSRGGHSSRGRSGFKRKYINPDFFINTSPQALVQVEYTPTHVFTDFGFSQPIINNLQKEGYTKPTHIQDETIPHVLEGKDVVGLANTGSGKTAAFILPIIHRLQTFSQNETALVIAPTRELADQINGEFRRFANGMKLFSTVCVGGLNLRAQKSSLAQNPHIVIATPGRLKQLVDEKSFNLKTVKVLVLDEVDRMLDMGFIRDIEHLVNQMQKERQTLCFSATINPSIKGILDKMLIDPITISVRTSETGEHIAQDVIRVSSREEKFSKLVEMLSTKEFEKVLVFTETKHGANKLATQLNTQKIAAEAIHGNKSQTQRQRSLNAFKQGRVNVLVATDVAARGLDIPNVSHVINYDEPQAHEDYVHRIGRTGRAGKPGKALTFIGVR